MNKKSSNTLLTSCIYQNVELIKFENCCSPECRECKACWLRKFLRHWNVCSQRCRFANVVTYRYHRKIFKYTSTISFTVINSDDLYCNNILEISNIIYCFSIKQKLFPRLLLKISNQCFRSLFHYPIWDRENR